jgi:hypothetical protein
MSRPSMPVSGVQGPVVMDRRLALRARQVLADRGMEGLAEMLGISDEDLRAMYSDAVLDGAE